MFVCSRHEGLSPSLLVLGFPLCDEQTKFRLALACGNIEVAMHTADKLPDDAIWHQLGTEALRQGNHQVPSTQLVHLFFLGCGFVSASFFSSLFFFFLHI